MDDKGKLLMDDCGDSSKERDYGSSLERKNCGDSMKKMESGSLSGKGSLGSFEQRILKFVRRYGLLKSGDLILTAVSGGADSVCLLLVLKELERILGIRVEAVTVNHGIRGASADRDVEFVRELCLEREIPVHVCSVDVPELVRREQLSEEEAARKARYQCFEQVAEKIGAQAVAVAHHRDDNCETILHHLFRGSGLRGLSGMAPQRSIGKRKIIRPFLEMGRFEIEAWLRERDISWCLDETNLEDDYTRNRIRRHVIPLVEQEVNERASAHVVQAGGYIAQAQALVEELAVQWLDQYGKCMDELDDGKFVCAIFQISVDALRSCKPIVRREIYMQVCRKVKGEPALKDVGHVHLEMLERLAVGETSRRVELPGGILVKRQYGFLVFQYPGDHEKKARSNQSFETLPEEIMGESGLEKSTEIAHKRSATERVLSDGRVIEVRNPELAEGVFFKISSYNGEKIPENNYTKWFDYDKIKNGLSLRTRQPGDYFLLDHGGRKKVKSYLIDRKVPADQRDEVLLLAEGSHVLWISDGRISAAYKVGRDTHNVLELYMKEEKLS